MRQVYDYCANILNKKIPAGELTILAVQRFLNDKKNPNFIFDEKKAQHAIDFFKFLNHYKGEHAGRPFELTNWQRFIVANLFGFYLKDGRRRYNYAYVEVAKKNGKSTFAAGIGLYMMIADKEAGAEIYSAATNHKQAMIVFDAARHLVMRSPHLKKFISVYRYNLHSLHNFSKFEALASDSDRLDGLNPHCAIIDEYHAHKYADLLNNLKSGMVARKNPLMFIITTAGFDKESPCFFERKVCVDILRGIKNQDNKFAVIYTLDDGDDWQDEKNWIKANPNLGISVDVDNMRKELKSVKNNDREIINYKTKNLNIWMSSSISWLKDDIWQACDKSNEFDIDDLDGQLCYAGLDLASHVDINAFVLFFPDEPVNHLICHFWVPEEKMKERSDKVDYYYWYQKGYLKVTPGSVIDIDYLASDILEIAHRYNLQSIAIDPAKAYHGVIQALQKEGLKMSEFRQGFISMSAPTREFERLITGKKLNHFGNPVLRWMNSNVELAMDAAGNIKVDRGRATDKVDGIVAAIMAIGEWMSNRADDNSIDEIIKERKGMLFL